MIETGTTPGHARHRARWVWIAVPPLVVVVALAVVAVVVLHDPARPVSVGEVVERFRTEADAGGGAGGPATTGAPPPPGVYVYDTAGSEEVDALDGSEHRYPDTTTVTVTAADAGCLSMRWDALAQRWDDEVVCPSDDGDGWSRTEATLFHSFFNQDETRTYTCDAPGVVPADEADGPVTWTCDSEGSGRSGASHEEGSGEVVGIEDVDVAGVARRALRVRYETEVSGETTGGGTTERWYALDRFPLVLREVVHGTSRSETAIGTVTYSEDYELALRTWDPRR